MEFTTAIGVFEAVVHPSSEGAVVVSSEDPRALEALRAGYLPDAEIHGDHVIVARDEWWHAIHGLQAHADG
jgi:hypothetical protein